VEHSEPLDKEIFCLADDQQPLCFDVATAAARAAGFTGEVSVGPASLEAFTEVFDQNEFITSAKARRVLGWVPRQPGILAHMDLYYQGWKAGQALEGAAFSRGY
jgi:nucleoside-diphosphate-sugar epimerase